jgi:hypothetical protein
MTSKMIMSLARPRHRRTGVSVVPDPEMLDYYLEEYQLGGVTRTLIRADPPSKGLSQRLPLGTEGAKKQDGLVGPLDVWLVHDLLNDLMS